MLSASLSYVERVVLWILPGWAAVSDFCNTCKSKAWFMLLYCSGSLATIQAIRHHRAFKVLRKWNALLCHSPSSPERVMAVSLYLNCIVSSWIFFLSSSQIVNDSNLLRSAVFGDGDPWYWTTNVVTMKLRRNFFSSLGCCCLGKWLNLKEEALLQLSSSGLAATHKHEPDLKVYISSSKQKTQMFVMGFKLRYYN